MAARGQFHRVVLIKLMFMIGDYPDLFPICALDATQVRRSPLIAQHRHRQSILAAIGERVRFARRRFGHYEGAT
jgi:hypothetical protein